MLGLLQILSNTCSLNVSSPGYFNYRSSRFIRILFTTSTFDGHLALYMLTLLMESLIIFIILHRYTLYVYSLSFLSDMLDK